MTAKNKTRGNTFEREIVELAQSMGLDAERAWGSDGRAMGETADVDVKVAGMRCQAKRRKAFPKWFAETILPADTVDFQAIRSDGRGGKPGYAVVKLDVFLRLLKMATLYGKSEDGGRTP